MTIHVRIRDENMPRTDVTELLLEMVSSTITVGDLIAERVRAELDNRLTDGKGISHPLVKITQKEALLNETSPTDPHARAIDPDRHIATAFSAFENNGFIMLVNDTQVETLEEQIDLTPDTVVTFLRLTPLVGG